MAAMLDEDMQVTARAVSNACASALRHVGRLTEKAPRRGIFAAISTLTELSSRAEASLENASRALDSGDADVAGLELARASALSDRMTMAATDTEASALPSLRRNG